MKLLFITSCLEPGKDGVGDYTRTLAGEIAKHNGGQHQCSMLALYDRLAKEVIREDVDGIPVLRCPADLSWPERQTLAAEFVKSFDPEWVSFQFVPYGYQDKGIVQGLDKVLAPLVRGRNVQWMFHELWIGDGPGEPLKHRVVGQLQRRAVKRLLGALKPRVIHTSNLWYQSRLASLGYQSRILPLFGNIPIQSKAADDWLFQVIGNHREGISSANRDHYYFAGFFGSIHDVWRPEPLFTHLLEGSRKAGKELVVLAAGRIGAAGEVIWKELEQRYAASMLLVNVGALESERMSQYLNALDFGIATSPIELIGKSGTATSMLEHGLPVIVNRVGEITPWDAVAAQKSQLDPGIIPMDDSLPQRMADGLPCGVRASKLPQVMAQMLNDLGIDSLVTTSQRTDV